MTESPQMETIISGALDIVHARSPPNTTLSNGFYHFLNAWLCLFFFSPSLFYLAVFCLFRSHVCRTIFGWLSLLSNRTKMCRMFDKIYIYSFFSSSLFYAAAPTSNVKLREQDKSWYELLIPVDSHCVHIASLHPTHTYRPAIVAASEGGFSLFLFSQFDLLY